MRILLLSLLLFSCNPVKQVLKDRERFEELAKEVVKSGYCANDTTFIYSKDTTISYDTIYEKGSTIIRDILHRDTLRVPTYKTIVKTITIRDTIKSVVVDNSRIKLLEDDLAVISKKADEYQVKAESRLKWLILILIAILIKILYKPIKRIILWNFSPMLK